MNSFWSTVIGIGLGAILSIAILLIPISIDLNRLAKALERLSK